MHAQRNAEAPYTMHTTHHNYVHLATIDQICATRLHRPISAWSDEGTKADWSDEGTVNVEPCIWVGSHQSEDQLDPSNASPDNYPPAESPDGARGTPFGLYARQRHTSSMLGGSRVTTVGRSPRLSYIVCAENGLQRCGEYVCNIRRMCSCVSHAPAKLEGVRRRVAGGSPHPSTRIFISQGEMHRRVLDILSSPFMALRHAFCAEGSSA